MESNTTLYVIVPCYNEEKVLPLTSQDFLFQLKEMISNGKISVESRILFVDDGSKDGTWEEICRLASEDDHFIGICQSRNRGHQNAVLAGLMESKDLCDITISIDCDGQDDVSVMSDMVDAYYEGNEIVYAVRNDRGVDTFFKRNSAEMFYKILLFLGVDCVYNHADYRLVSSKALESFSEFQEVNIFLRGMFPLVGYKSTKVYYKRGMRAAGESHYSFKNMVGLALDGVTSLSTKPLHLITVIGAIFSLLSFVGTVCTAVSYVMDRTTTGWGLIACFICFVCGIQIFSLGLVGEYVGKIYMETKRRPRYIISKRTWEKSKVECQKIQKGKCED